MNTGASKLEKNSCIWSRRSNDSDSEELDMGRGEAQRTLMNKAREKLRVKK